VTSSGEIFGGFDQLLGTSLVLLTVVFGLALSDLRGWTFTTRFAVIEQGRVGAFCLAAVCFVSSLIVSVALAADRLLALMSDETALSPETMTAWVQGLPVIILLALAVLLFLGVFFTFINLDTFFSTLIAFSMVIGGLCSCVVYVALAVVDLVLEILSVIVTTLLGSAAPLSSTVHNGLQTMTGGMTKAWRSAVERLNTLVGRTPRGAVEAVKTTGGPVIDRTA
jgi:hypothetical protein